MKPNKSVVYCNNCERKKILFDTEKAAENFMKFNNEEIESISGYSPNRSYFCIFCNGWHITSKKDFIGLSKNEKLFEKYIQENEPLVKNIENIDKSKKIDVLTVISHIYNEGNFLTDDIESARKEKKYIKIQELENKIKKMTDSEKEEFFSENINIINTKIELLLNSEKLHKIKLKKLREELMNLYIFRKKYTIIRKKRNSWKYKN